MRIRPFVLPGIAAAVVLSGPLFGYEAGLHSARSSGSAHHVYRLDYTVTITEPGKAAVTDNYTLNVEDGHGGDVHAGANIPLVSSTSPSLGGSPRQDVGITLRCDLTRVGNDLLVQTKTELSAPGERFGGGAVAIQKITSNSDGVVTPGSSALVASVEEPVSHARYDVTVTATKLR